MIEIPTEWSLDPENKESKKLNEIVSSHARKLMKALEKSEADEEKYAALFSYYRKFYTLTLCKSCLAAGINKSPARDSRLKLQTPAINEAQFSQK